MMALAEGEQAVPLAQMTTRTAFGIKTQANVSGTTAQFMISVVFFLSWQKQFARMIWAFVKLI